MLEKRKKKESERENEVNEMTVIINGTKPSYVEIVKDEPNEGVKISRKVTGINNEPQKTRQLMREV